MPKDCPRTTQKTAGDIVHTCTASTAVLSDCDVADGCSHCPVTEQEVMHELEKLGADVMEPESKKEKILADALEAFSFFVLYQEKETCQAIIDKHMGNTANPLQGGSEEFEIYRLSIANDEAEDETAAGELLAEFHGSRQGKQYASVITKETLKGYMLGMCEKRSSKLARYGKTNMTYNYQTLCNPMLILAFGPVEGQIRHIDHMEPNIPVFLYMSTDCPSTIVYKIKALPGCPYREEDELQEPSKERIITSSSQLVAYWEGMSSIRGGRDSDHTANVPELIKIILLENSQTKLSEKQHTKFFAFWGTIDAHLGIFGKLYQPVELELSLLRTRPGTTVMVSGNEVHAGPPTAGPRMFAFAIGVADEEDEYRSDNDEGNLAGKKKKVNDGEVQYNPVLLHVDLCCILFSIIRFEYADRDKEEHEEAKRFLLHLLLPFIKEYPNETWDRLIDNNRTELREWLGTLVTASQEKNHIKVQSLLQEGVQSELIFCSPGADTSKKKKRQQKKKKRHNAMSRMK